MTVCRQFESRWVEERKPLRDFASTIMKCAMCSPRAYDLTCAMRDREQVLVVIWADRVRVVVKGFRIGGAKCKEVTNNQAAMALSPREADAPANRRVILAGVRYGRVQHEEGDLGLLRIPLSLETVTVGTAS